MMKQTTEILKKIKNEKLSIGLAVEGGGLRGIISLAMLQAIKDLGLKDQVKCLSGTSSGAINSAYFLCDQLDDGRALYREMASTDFIQPTKWPNAMNLDFLFLDRIPKHHPLNMDKLLKSAVDFHVTVTRTENGVSETLKTNDLKNESEVLRTLRASASAPLFSTNKEIIRGVEYNDGHVQMAIPYQPLLKYDVDYVLCLQTQKKGYKKTEGFFGKLHRKLATMGFSKSYRRSFKRSKELYNQQLEEINGLPNTIGLQIEPEDFMVSKMTKNPQDMDQCFDSALHRIKLLFN